MGTDRDWEAWGASDPYYGVYSHARFRVGALDEAARAEFFASGETHVSRTLEQIALGHGAVFTPDSVLDFGCGVGRLVVPFARRAACTVGVDVSPSMLDECRRNCETLGVSGVEWVLSDDHLSRVPGSFDLVHSHIVLQHIAPRRGRLLIDALAARVSPGGVLAIQFLSECHAPPLIRALTQLRYVFPPANWLRNLSRARPLREPAMQLHVYPAESVRRGLEQQGFDVVQFEEEFDCFVSATVVARRRLPGTENARPVPGDPVGLTPHG